MNQPIIQITADMLDGSVSEEKLTRLNDRAEIVHRILQRERLLTECNEDYHNGIPRVPDTTYDAVWREHEEDRRNWPSYWDGGDYLFANTGSILDKVGALPKPTSGFQKVRHGNPMKSINDVFEGDGDGQYDELLAFVREMETKLGNNAWPMLVEPKVDGMAVKLIYRNGLLALGVTRGDGEVGDDITDNIRISQVAPQSITPDEPWNGTQAHPLNADPLEIVGEVYMPLEAFAAVNAKRDKQGLDLWANPRNAASGSMKLQDAEELRKRPLAFVRHDSCDPWVDGIGHVGSIEVFDWTKLVEAVETVRNFEDVFAIDGAVVKLPTGRGRDVLGMGTRAPNWACAFKFKPEQMTTILEGIDVQVGRTGVLAPVARLKPVLVDGTTVSRATLNNEDFINSLGLQVGDEVVIQKQGAIIPAVVRSVTFSELCRPNTLRVGRAIGKSTDLPPAVESRSPFSLVAHLGGKCPCCGSTDLQKQEIQKGEGAKWCCMSTACPAQLSARIEHFCSRGCLDIEGIGAEASIAIAEAMGMMNIDNPMDLMEWTVGDLMALTWVTDSGGQMTFGESRAAKAVAALERAKYLPLHRWIRALGIPSVGENTSKELSRLFRDINELAFSCEPGGVIAQLEEGASKTDGNLAKLGISSHLGVVSPRKLIDFFTSDAGAQTRAIVQSFGVKSDNYDPIPTASDAKPLFGKNFAITGTLSVSRDEMKALIEAKGGKVSGSVTGKTDYLIAGEGGGKKSTEAAKKGVLTIDEATLREML